MKNITTLFLLMLTLTSCNGGGGGSHGAEISSLLYGGTWTREWEWCPGNNCTGGITYLDEELTFSGNTASFRSFIRGTTTPFNADGDWTLTPVNSSTVFVQSGMAISKYTYAVTATTLRFCDPSNSCLVYTR